jgi:hypothetical protein
MGLPSINIGALSLRPVYEARMKKGEADLRAEPLVTGAEKFEGDKVLKRFGAKRDKN